MFSLAIIFLASLPLFSPFLSFPFDLLDLIASLTSTGYDNFERDVRYRTLRATPYPTYDARCLLLVLSAWSFVSRFVFKFQFWLWKCRLPQALFPSNSPVCPRKARRRTLKLSLSRSTRTPNTSYRAHLRFDSDFPPSFISYSRTFPHKFAERSTTLHYTISFRGNIPGFVRCANNLQHVQARVRCWTVTGDVKCGCHGGDGGAKCLISLDTHISESHDVHLSVHRLMGTYMYLRLRY